MFDLKKWYKANQSKVLLVAGGIIILGIVTTLGTTSKVGCGEGQDEIGSQTENIGEDGKTVRDLGTAERQDGKERFKPLAESPYIKEMTTKKYKYAQIRTDFPPLDKRVGKEWEKPLIKIMPFDLTPEPIITPKSKKYSLKDKWQHDGVAGVGVAVSVDCCRLDTNKCVMVAGSAGLYKTSNLKDWERIENFGTYDINNVSISSQNCDSIMVFSENFRVSMSVDNGATWKDAYAKDSFFTGGLEEKNADTFWFGNNVIVWRNKKFLLSKDNGNFFAEKELPEKALFLKIKENGRGIFYNKTKKQVYTSSDYGENWEKTVANPPTATEYTAIDVINDRIALAGKDNNGRFIVKSTDDGKTWANKIYPTGASGGHEVQDIVLSSFDEKYCGIFKYVDGFKESNDGCNTFTLKGDCNNDECEDYITPPTITYDGEEYLAIKPLDLRYEVIALIETTEEQAPNPIGFTRMVLLSTDQGLFFWNGNKMRNIATGIYFSDTGRVAIGDKYIYTGFWHVGGQFVPRENIEEKKVYVAAGVENYGACPIKSTDIAVWGSGAVTDGLIKNEAYKDFWLNNDETYTKYDTSVPFRYHNGWVYKLNDKKLIRINKEFNQYEKLFEGVDSAYIAFNGGCWLLKDKDDKLLHGADFKNLINFADLSPIKNDGIVKKNKPFRIVYVNLPVIAVAGQGKIAGDGNPVYVSTDNGITWKNTLKGITGSNIVSDKNGYLYAAVKYSFEPMENTSFKMNWGVMRSTDNGMTWLNFGNNNKYKVTSLAYDEENNMLYAATSEAGLLKISIP